MALDRFIVKRRQDIARVKKEFQHSLSKQAKLRRIQIISFSLALVLGAVTGFGYVNKDWIFTLDVAKFFFLVGLAATVWRIQTGLSVLSATAPVMTDIEHDQTAAMQQQTNLMNRMVDVFLTEQDGDISLNKPHLTAYVLTGRLSAQRHFNDMVKNFETLQGGGEVLIKDIPITADFLSYIVQAIDKIGSQQCTWMGTSLVVNGQSWNDDRSPLYTFKLELRSRAKSGKLDVYKLYVFDKDYYRKPSRKSVAEFKRHLKEEEEANIRLKQLTTGAVVEDFSLICIPNEPNSTFKPTPATSYEELAENGWVIACGILWDIQGGSRVGGATVYPGDTNWVKKHYIRLNALWNDPGAIPYASEAAPPPERPNRGRPPAAA
ncbi:MAG TPA: hypothetical protein VK422_16890 [Pyrinomonadaceae bacterium]|nr:hypothetical protein [Pyrinomonadaceae bacterium]